MIPQDEIEAAVLVARSGQDPFAFLEEENPEKRNIMARIANRAQEMRLEENEHLARLIINRLAESMK